VTDSRSEQVAAIKCWDWAIQRHGDGDGVMFGVREAIVVDVGLWSRYFRVYLGWARSDELKAER
jgi:hypothetical protein